VQQQGEGHTRFEVFTDLAASTLSAQDDATAEPVPGKLHVPANRIERQSCRLPCFSSKSLQERAIYPMQEATHKEVLRRLLIDSSQGYATKRYRAE
jgi:hypothetical protein